MELNELKGTENQIKLATIYRDEEIRKCQCEINKADRKANRNSFPENARLTYKNWGNAQKKLLEKLKKADVNYILDLYHQNIDRPKFNDCIVE